MVFWFNVLHLFLKLSVVNYCLPFSDYPLNFVTDLANIYVMVETPCKFTHVCYKLGAIQQLRGPNVRHFLPPIPLEWTKMDILHSTIYPLWRDPCGLSTDPPPPLLVHVVIECPITTNKMCNSPQKIAWNKLSRPYVSAQNFILPVFFFACLL